MKFQKTALRLQVCIDDVLQMIFEAHCAGLMLNQQHSNMQWKINRALSAKNAWNKMEKW